MVTRVAVGMAQLFNIEFFTATALANSPDNPRVASEDVDYQRGTGDAADGTVLAKSLKATSGGDHSWREYANRPRCSVLTGDDSMIGSPEAKAAPPIATAVGVRVRTQDLTGALVPGAIIKAVVGASMARTGTSR